MRALTVDPETWFSDALLEVPPVAPLPVTITLCAANPMTGVLFTKANATTASNSYCLVGDPAKLRTACTLPADCDGPSPTTGNGICGTRAVSYTSESSYTAPGEGVTAYTYGVGVAGPAGSALFAQDLNVSVWLNKDATCTGDGSNASCVGCNGQPAPVGRIGVLTHGRFCSGGTNIGAQCTDDAQCPGPAGTVCSPDALNPAAVHVPLNTRFSTGSSENIITTGSQAGKLDGREVSGTGTPGLTAQLVVAGGGAQLHVDTAPAPFGFADVQFYAKQVFGPYNP
jgi:hypothetical protein